MISFIVLFHLPKGYAGSKSGRVLDTALFGKTILATPSCSMSPAWSFLTISPLKRHTLRSGVPNGWMDLEPLTILVPCLIHSTCLVENTFWETRCFGVPLHEFCRMGSQFEAMKMVACLGSQNNRWASAVGDNELEDVILSPQFQWTYQKLDLLFQDSLDQVSFPQVGVAHE